MVRIKIGPGPGKYKLPPLTGYPGHDLSKYRNPAYTIGINTKFEHKQWGPGPGRYQIEKMNQHGKDSPPAYSLKLRQKSLTKMKIPSPMDHEVHKKPIYKGRNPPAYSIKFRQKPLTPFQTPGANKYPKPSTIGPRVPDLPANGAYSIGLQREMKVPSRSPGPARYGDINSNLYKNRNPAYSLLQQTKILGRKEPFPAPNRYYPLLGSCGGFSIGIRTEPNPYITPEDEMPCVEK